MAEAWVSLAFVWATGGDAAGVGGPTCTALNATDASHIVPQAVPGHACHYDLYPHNPACGHHAYCNTGREECGCCADDPDVGQCALLSGTFSGFVQLLCAVMGFGSLVLKKKLLDDKKGVDRGWVVWGMDVAKQGTSGVAAHLAGMFNSWLLDDPDEGGNGCSWYFISFTFDTTLGVVIGYFLLQLLQKVAKSGIVGGYKCSSLQSSGNYKKEGTDEVDYLIWAKQMGSWCTITVIARACVGCLLLLNKFWLQSVSQWVAGLFKCHPDGFLVLVMLGCPFGMNALQLWVQDQFLKESDGSPSKFEKMLHRCKGSASSDLEARLTVDDGSMQVSDSMRMSASAGAFSTENIQPPYDGRSSRGGE